MTPSRRRMLHWRNGRRPSDQRCVQAVLEHRTTPGYEMTTFDGRPWDHTHQPRWCGTALGIGGSPNAEGRFHKEILGVRALGRWRDAYDEDCGVLLVCNCQYGRQALAS